MWCLLNEESPDYDMMISIQSVLVEALEMSYTEAAEAVASWAWDLEA